MSKRISQLTQLTAAQLASNDILAIVDVSAGQTKYITVKDLTGLPDFGWTATGESWAYSSWDSTTRIGVITVPTDATIKYTPKNRVRLARRPAVPSTASSQKSQRRPSRSTSQAVPHSPTRPSLRLYTQVKTALSASLQTWPTGS